MQIYSEDRMACCCMREGRVAGGHSALTDLALPAPAAGCALTVGIFSRFSAVLAWFLHLCAARSGSFVSYGVDDFIDDRSFLPHALAAAGSAFRVDCLHRKVRPGIREARLFSARSAITFVTHLFLQRPNEMSGEWLVERRESLARADTAALQRCCCRIYSLGSKLLFPMLGIAICLLETAIPSSFGCGERDSVALGHSHHARRDRTYDGNVPFRHGDDRPQSCCLCVDLYCFQVRRRLACRRLTTN